MLLCSPEVERELTRFALVARASTVAGYRSDLRAAEAWGGPLSGWDGSMVRTYVNLVRLRAPGGVRRAVASLRWWGRSRGCEWVDRLDLPPLRRRSAVGRHLTGDELRGLLGACDVATDSGVRDLALFALLADTGLRAAEVCRLDFRQVDLGRLSLSVEIKGGDVAGAVFSAFTGSALANWFDLRRHLASVHCGAAFVSVGGNTPGRRLTTSGLRVICRRAADRAGLGALSPHDFRRTFAVLALRSGAPSRVVQLGGRWSSLQMVEHYSRGLEVEAVREYLPLAALGSMR